MVSRQTCRSPEMKSVLLREISLRLRPIREIGLRGAQLRTPVETESLLLVGLTFSFHNKKKLSDGSHTHKSQQK